MAKSTRTSTRIPQLAYNAAAKVGRASAHAWFANPEKSMGNHMFEARVEYVGNVIDTQETGEIRLAERLDGFAHGFERGIAQIIAGGGE